MEQRSISIINQLQSYGMESASSISGNGRESNRHHQLAVMIGNQHHQLAARIDNQHCQSESPTKCVMVSRTWLDERLPYSREVGGGHN